jgi:cytochrome bd-type quinol oxidase subunit 2
VVSCATLGFGLVGATEPGSRLASDVITYLAPIGVAVCLAIILALRTRSLDENRFWVQLAVALGLVAAAESYWTWYAARVDPSGPPMLSPLLLVYFASGLAFISRWPTALARCSTSLQGYSSCSR